MKKVRTNKGVVNILAEAGVVPGTEGIQTPGKDPSKLDSTLTKGLSATSGALDLLSNGLSQSQVDTSAYDAQTKMLSTINIGGDYDNIFNTYSNIGVTPDVTAHDLRPISIGQDVLSAVGSGIQGGMEGSQFGLIGAAVGAGVGTASSAIGSWLGRKRAAKESARITGNNKRATFDASVKLYNAIDAARQRRVEADRVNIQAMGGDLNSAGANFPTELIEINAGGTHTQNPMGGVRFGMDQEGTPNLVEQGETIYNSNGGKFAFSNQIFMTKEECAKLGIKYRKKLSVADASKLLNKEIEERPNDNISKRGQQAALSELSRYQEEIKQRQAEEQAIQQQLAMQEVGINPEIQYALGGNIFLPGGTVDTDWAQQRQDERHPVEVLNTQNVSGKVGTLPFNFGYVDGNYVDYWTAYLKAQQQAEQEAAQIFNSNLVSPDNNIREYYNSSYPLGQYSAPWTMFSTVSPKTPVGTYIGKPLEETEEEQVKPDKKPKEQTTNTDTDTTFGGTSRYFSEAPRYTSPIINAMQIAHNLATKPDNSNAESIERYATNSMAPAINPEYISNYLEYDPIDMNYYMTKAMAQSNAIRNMIQNNSNGNGALVMPNLANNAYITQMGLGDAYIKGKQYNAERKKDSITHNTEVDKFNATASMSAQEKNIANYLASRQLGLQGVIEGAKMRETSARNRLDDLQASINALSKDLTGIGQENVSKNQYKDLLLSGYFGMPSSKPKILTKKEWNTMKKRYKEDSEFARNIKTKSKEEVQAESPKWSPKSFVNPFAAPYQIDLSKYYKG